MSGTPVRPHLSRLVADLFSYSAVVGLAMLITKISGNAEGGTVFLAGSALWWAIRADSKDQAPQVSTVHKNKNLED